MHRREILLCTKLPWTLMPHHATFKLFFIVYAWLGLWVFLQMLPHESLLRSVAYHQKRQRFGSNSYDSGTANSMAIYTSSWLKLTIMLPRFHKWQLTVLAYKRWVSGLDTILCSLVCLTFCFCCRSFFVYIGQPFCHVLHCCMCSLSCIKEVELSQPT